MDRKHSSSSSNSQYFPEGPPPPDRRIPQLTILPLQLPIDRSASLALTKLMSTKRGGGGEGDHLVSPPSSSTKPKNLMFNHKHLQYIPLAAHQDHRQRRGPHPPQPPHQHHLNSGMTSMLTLNGRGGHVNYNRQGQDPPQLSPVQQQQQQHQLTERERLLRQQHFQQQQRLHPPPVTKSIGVGANLNYTRSGAVIGRPVGQGHLDNSEPRDLRHMPYPQHPRYEVPPPHSSPGTHGHGPNVTIGHHGVGHPSSESHHSNPRSETTPQKLTTVESLGGHTGQSSPVTTRDQSHSSHSSNRSGSPPGLPKSSKIPHPTSLSSAQLDMFNSHKTQTQKIVNQNLNGTLSVTGVPSNDSELQLFRVLQRANLLNYFDVMIELGGDDVQQLCDAGEEEFLEIMALIGMASKPLHVRRLQKSLQEFMTNPNLFPNPMLGPPLSVFTQGQGGSGERTGTTTTTSGSTSSLSGSKPQFPIRPIPFHSAGGAPPGHHFNNPPGDGRNETPRQRFQQGIREEQTRGSGTVVGHNNLGGMEQSQSPNHHHHLHSNNKIPNSPPPIHNNTNNHPNPSNSNVTTNSCFPSPSSSTSSNSSYPGTPFTLPNGISVQFPRDHPHVTTTSTSSSQFLLETRLREGGNSGGGTADPSVESSGEPITTVSENPDSRSSLSPVPFLQEAEIQKIKESALRLIQTLPEELVEPKVTAKRKGAADFETVIRIPDEDPKKEEEIRKFATIYARYNCKRKALKPLTIHELSANEAASQLCLRLPALLTRREDLKILSREVIRNAGLPYSSIISATPFKDFGSNGRKTPLLSIGTHYSQEYKRPRSAPSHSTNLGDEMQEVSETHERSRPESSPATAHSDMKIILRSPTPTPEGPLSLTLNHGPRKRATAALLPFTPSPKGRKLDEEMRGSDDLRNLTLSNRNTKDP